MDTIFSPLKADFQFLISFPGLLVRSIGRGLNPYSSFSFKQAQPVIIVCSLILQITHKYYPIYKKCPQSFSLKKAIQSIDF
jgi:hypothetical protein